MATKKKKSNVVKMYRINSNDEITAINTYGEFDFYGEKRVWTKKGGNPDYPRRYSEPARNLFKTPKAAIKSLDRRCTKVIECAGGVTGTIHPQHQRTRGIIGTD
jgi:hypothetical protein